MFLKVFDAKQGMSLADFIQSNFRQDIMNLGALRRELQRFFVDHGLPGDLTTNHKWWSSFLYLYCGVVSEAPIRYAKQDLLPDEVQEVTVSRKTRTTTPQKTVCWTVVLKNGLRFDGAALYGDYRNARGHLTGLPDFYLQQGFQL